MMLVYESKNLQLQFLKEQLGIFQTDSLRIAQQIYIWYDLEIYKNIDGRCYSDIYEFSKKELDIARKTVNAYLDVVHVYFDMNVNTENQNKTVVCDIEFTLKDKKFEYFNFSQLRACLRLNSNELDALDIKFDSPVYEIEKKKKEYFKSINNEIDEAQDLEDKKETEKEDITFDSLNDIKRNIDIFKDNFIPETSEIEILFKQDETLLKGKKKKYNYNTSLKILRTMLENNSEEQYFYAVVKIKKPL